MATSGKSSSQTPKKTTKSKASSAKPSSARTGASKASPEKAEATKEAAAKFATGRGKADAVMAAVKDSEGDPTVQANKAPNDATLVLKDAVVEKDVAGAKDGAKKSAGAKPAEKKPAEKKTAGAKPATRKPDDKTITDTKSAEKPAKSTPVEAAPVQAEQGSTFFPMVLGGIVAGILGFGVALIAFPDGVNGGNQLTERTVKTQAETLTALQGEMVTVGQRIDTLAAQQDGIGGQIETLSADITALSDQFANAPQADPTLLSDELAATLAAQKGELARLQGELEKMAAFAQSQIEAAEAEQMSAEQAEARVKARGALNFVRDALVSGDPFADALPDIAAAVDVPENLAAVAKTGVPSLNALQGDFADGARAALSASVRETAGDTTGNRLKLFLQDQLGARSLSPREGDDPDAVLSRAEAALKAGDIAGALDLLTNLPGSGQQALADWSDKAQTREAALSGFDEITNALSDN